MNRLATWTAVALVFTVPLNAIGQVDKGLEDSKAWTEPYALPTCPVSELNLDTVGDPIVKAYGGREVRFCCAPCIKKFEADPDVYWKKADEAIVKDQLRYYPLDSCIVIEDPLVEDDKDVAINHVYGNRLFRLCCRMCVRKFTKNPNEFIKKLNTAVIEAQRDDYPLNTCVVRGSKLGSMGDPIELVIAGRLVRLCCAGCKPKLKADPLEYLAKIDEAWQAKDRYMPAPTEGDK